MSTREYLQEHLSTAWRILWEEKAPLFFGAVWHAIHEYFGLFWATSPLYWLCLLWGLDFVLGSYRAWSAGEWSARRALLSAVKLATWASVLSVGHVMRHSGLLGGSLIASALDAVVLLAEASSVLAHAGAVLGNPDLERIGRAFGRGSRRAALKAANLLDPEEDKGDKNNG